MTVDGRIITGRSLGVFVSVSRAEEGQVSDSRPPDISRGGFSFWRAYHVNDNVILLSLLDGAAAIR